MTTPAPTPPLSPDRFRFEPAVLPPEAYSYPHLMATWGMSKREAKQQVAAAKESRIVRSDTYQVWVRDVPCKPFGITLTHLSIKRNDRGAFSDWRELQAIKNAVVGPEREAVELFPAESRVVDTANQMHLWVLPEGAVWPFGYRDRAVEDNPGGGAAQRPFDPALRPAAPPEEIE